LLKSRTSAQGKRHQFPLSGEVQTSQSTDSKGDVIALERGGSQRCEAAWIAAMRYQGD
jgi:hypothetical protein